MLWDNDDQRVVTLDLSESLPHRNDLLVLPPILEGTLPPELGKLTELQYLRLGRNRLTGTIPKELGKLTNLGCLALYGNPGLTGRIPQALINLPTLAISTHEIGISDPRSAA